LSISEDYSDVVLVVNYYVIAEGDERIRREIRQRSSGFVKGFEKVVNAVSLKLKSLDLFIYGVYFLRAGIIWACEKISVNNKS
jgi:hypothetical protein